LNSTNARLVVLHVTVYNTERSSFAGMLLFITQSVHPLLGCLKKYWGHKLRVYPLTQKKKKRKKVMPSKMAPQGRSRVTVG